MKYVQLDLNENPFSVPKSVRHAIENSIKQSNRYPEKNLEKINRQLAKYFDVPAENILLTQGIDESVDHLIHTFPDKRFVTLTPGFNGYEGRIKAKQKHHLVLRRTLENPSPDQDQLKHLNNDDFLILANPCNPTGVYLEEEKVHDMLNRVGGSLLDLAYIEYSEAPKPKIKLRPQRFYFYSFSKSFSLAAMRLGVLIGDQYAVESMKRQQWFCHFNSPAIAAALAIIKEKEWLHERVEIIKKERQRLYLNLKGLGVNVWPTQTNFLLISVADSIDLNNFLHQRGFIVKPTIEFGLKNWLRVTIASRSENDQLAVNLAAYVQKERFL